MTESAVLLPPVSSTQAAGIPASQYRCHAAPQPVVVWVKRGYAQVTVNADVEELGPCAGIWLPSGSTYSVETEVDSVVILLQIPDEGMGAATARRFQTDASAAEAMVHLLSHQLAYLVPDDSVFRVVTQAIVERSRPLHLLPERLLPPPRPHSLRLRQLVALVADSSRPSTSELAEQAMLSVRGLQRRWEAETGMSVGSWFRQRRLHRAAVCLLEGHSTEWASSVAGFSSPSGFIRAFTRAGGMTPKRFVQASRENTPAQAGALQPIQLPPRESVPAQRTWARVNLADVAVWAYRGDATVSLDGTERTLPQGHAMILPKGVSNSLATAPGGIVVPVGYSAIVAGAPAAFAPAPVDLSDHEDLLLHCLVATYTPLRPPGYHPARGVTIVAGPVPLDQHTIEELVPKSWGRDSSVLDRQRRLNHARELLAAGARPAEASREVGYAHPSAFTRAFRREYGLSPSYYCQSLSSQADWRRHQT